MPVTEDRPAPAQARPERSVLTEPYWVTLFLLIAVAASFLPFGVGFLLGMSVTNTSVFGIYALIGGLLADVVMRRTFRTTLVLFRSPRIPFVAAWILLCLYVIAFRPF